MIVIKYEGAVVRIEKKFDLDIVPNCLEGRQESPSVTDK
jgi:hypothetical protein